MEFEFNEWTIAGILGLTAVLLYSDLLFILLPAASLFIIGATQKPH